MSTNNQNFIIGLISAIALVVGLVSTIISIHKTNLEIRELYLKIKGKKATSKTSSMPGSRPGSHKPPITRKHPISIEIIIDVLFFLLFSIGSIDAILEYLANTVPKFTLIAALFFVPIYSFTLLINIPRPVSQNTPPPSEKEQRYFKLVGQVGLFISLAFWLLLGIQRLTPIFFTPSPYDSTIAKLFSLVVNLAVAPLLVFSLVSLHRIIRYIANVVISQERA
jgi:hypothetical protein